MKKITIMVAALTIACLGMGGVAHAADENPFTGPTGKETPWGTLMRPSEGDDPHGMKCNDMGYCFHPSTGSQAPAPDPTHDKWVDSLKKQTPIGVIY
ncbi:MULTISPECIES: hypothetical protein [unclassified Streptomyces]|uniref:hypothetical protein n=1 Tax=unclassified Streptomyces TaxID=2593676 RepID=UPI00365EB974